MKSKKILYIVVLTTFVSMCVFGTVLVHAFWYDPVSETLPTPTAIPSNSDNTYRESNSTSSLPATSDNPKYLVIPTLNIDAKIQDVGITKNGNMATPNNFTDVGWYEYGTRPGEIGSTVIAGHVDDGLALPAVFNHLGDLKKGDYIYVNMENGERIKYIVSDLATYDYNADAQAVFNENDAKYLKLITCAGVWVESYKTHNKRLVVTAIEV